jgi:chromosome segregation ATPase
VKKKVLIGTAGLLVGFILGLTYSHIQLANEQKAHQAKLKEMTQRLSLTQRKFVEERTLQTSLEDDKQAIQTQLDALTKEKEHLTTENKDLKSKVATLEPQVPALEKKVASLETRASSLDAKNTQLTERLAKTEADRAALDKKEHQTSQSLQEREKELKQLTVDSRTQYDRCAAHNARLYTIAEEVIHQYEKKGVVKSLLTSEPFTQIKKVELEKLVQDYKDQIEQQKLGK